MTATATEPRLSTTEIADLIGVDCHTLSASITKLWWSYLEGQDAQVGNGRRRSYSPVDAVVIEMLVTTGEIGNDLVNTVREHFAARIYEAHTDRDPADEHPEVIVLAVADGQMEISFRPAWFLIDHATRIAEEAPR